MRNDEPVRIPKHLDPNQRNDPRDGKTDLIEMIAATNPHVEGVVRDETHNAITELAEFIRDACKARCAARFVEMSASWVLVRRDGDPRTASMVADILADIDRGEQNSGVNKAVKAMVTALFFGHRDRLAPALAAWNECGCEECARRVAEGESRVGCRCQPSPEP